MIRRRYLTEIDVDGMDREPLTSGLEDEPGALHLLLPGGELFRQIAAGRIQIDTWLDHELPGFGEALAAVSAYLSQIVDGFEISEELDADGRRRAVTCRRYIARSAEVISVPLGHGVSSDGEIQPDREDPRVLETLWPSLPQWARDGYRQSFPQLRSL